MIGSYSYLLLVVLCCFGVDINAQDTVGVNRDANIEDYPHEVGLYRDGDFKCGGILVDESKVITPAHCIKYPNEPERYSIRAGSSYADNGTETPIAKIKIHPKYDENTHDYDIVVLNLETPESIKAIELAEENDNEPNNAVASGWSPEDEGDPESEMKLTSADVEIFDEHRCEKLYPGITERLICVTNPTVKGNVCKGYAGSALIYQDKLYAMLVRGKNCGEKKDASLYLVTKESSIKQFIEN